MSLNSQRFLRTGDNFYFNDCKATIHYVIDKDGQLSFEEPIHNIKTILAFNGNKIEEFDPLQIKLESN